MAGLLSLVAPQLSAANYYTSGHADIGIEYTPGEPGFEAHWHVGAGSVINGVALTEGAEFSPDSLIALLDTTVTVTDTKITTALGVRAGVIVYRTGASAYPPNLGFGLEEVGNPADWANESITISLTDFSGPGEVAMAQNVSGLGNIVWFSSLSDSFTTSNNTWEFGVGGHQHLDMFFSETGYYELTIAWTGTYIGDGFATPIIGSGTYGFQVGQAMVPEPVTYAAIASLAVLGLALCHYVRCPQANR